MTLGKTLLKRAIPKAILDPLFVFKHYGTAFGKYPNVLFPTSFNEKIARRMMFDRRAVLTQVADKFSVRKYVEDRLGSEILPRLYWVTTDPSDIPFDILPKEFVVKPTHGSGWVSRVEDKCELDTEQLIRDCEHWLSLDFSQAWQERWYKDIPPRIVIEEFIDDGTIGGPIDYKFYVFHGKVELVFVVCNRFSSRCVYFCDRDWNKLDVRLSDQCVYPAHEGPVAPPKYLDRALEAANILGKEFDFIRVDFYMTDDKVYFGELTAAPFAGRVPFEPRSFDQYLGSFW